MHSELTHLLATDRAAGLRQAADQIRLAKDGAAKRAPDRRDASALRTKVFVRCGATARRLSLRRV